MRAMFPVLLAAAAIAVPASAAVVSGTLTGGTALSNGGTFVVIGNPSGLTVGQNNFQNNNVRAFNEQQSVVLGSALSIDAGVGSATSIAAGTRIDSHYMNFDPANGRSVLGSATFDRPVIGLIWSRANLINSHYLGAAGVTYLNPTLVGFETNTDSASFSGNTVYFDLDASSPGDSWRVITRVPEPSTWAMLIAGFGLVGAVARRRSRVATV